MTRRYTFRILLLWQALLVFTLGLLLGLGLFLGILWSGIVPDVAQHAVGTLLAVFCIGGTFLATQNWLSTGLLAVLDERGLQLIFEKPARAFQAQDHYLFWQDLLEWDAVSGHTSGHSIAPPTLTFKLAAGGKIFLLIAGTSPAYEAFLEDLEMTVRTVNQRSATFSRITQKPPFYQRKSVCWVMGAIYALLLVAVNWFVWVSGMMEDTFLEKIAFSGLFSSAALMMIWVSIKNYRAGQILSKQFVKK